MYINVIAPGAAIFILLTVHCLFTQYSPEESAMTLLTTVVVLAMLATIGALLTGVGSMAHGGVFDRKHSAQFMSARIILQAVAVGLMLAALYLTLGK